MNSIIIADLKLDNPEHYRAHDSSYIGALTSYGASSPYFTSFVVYRNDELFILQHSGKRRNVQHTRY
ncbi:MAG: hypothetical protein L6V93_17110 [Clostridiales bacterium]|nr:MAG: hypothetical protein L6V93_17110 [Clostridiales bacterium]